MAIARAFIHTAKVTRPTAGAADVLNQPTAGAAATVATALPGRLVERREQLVSDAWAAAVLATTYQWLTAASADLLPGDILTRITLEDGTALAQSFRVVAVLRRAGGNAAHHKAATLEVVS